MTPPPRTESTPRTAIGFVEFVALMAALMAINALGIDSMLPALPAIGDSLGITTENQRQWIISCYLIGFGVAQMIHGPLADRYGRRPVMLTSLVIYAGASFLASYSTSFETMIAARVFQGMAAAGGRVLVVSIVRDCYSGRQMARVMSLAFIVFMAVPILAPSIGQLIMLVAPWRAIFDALALFALGVAIWTSIRLGETLHPEFRRPISIAGIASAFRLVTSNRTSIGYTLALTMMFGAMTGFINSAQQVFADALGHPEILAIAFATIAAAMGLASFCNSRIVERLGSRIVSHSALIGFIVMCVIHLLWTVTIGDTLVSFIVLQFMTMFCFGFTGSNFGSMAMEPMGAIAGTASSVQGTISTLGAAVIGITIGQNFNGTVLPVLLGFLFCGVAALTIVLITEGGRLFRAQHAMPVHQ